MMNEDFAIFRCNSNIKGEFFCGREEVGRPPPGRHRDGHAREGVAATGGVRVAGRDVAGESSAIFDRAAGGVRHNSLREHRWPTREK